MPVRPAATFRSAVATLVAAAVVVALLPAAASADEEPTRLLVTYRVPVDAEVALADAGVSRTVDPVEDAGPSRVRILELPDAATAAAVDRLLGRRPGVAAVEPDVELHLHEAATTHDTPTTLAGAAPQAEQPAPGGLAWGIRNRGQAVDGRPGQPAVDIGAEQAWPVATGRGVVVAVIDTGVDTSHPLLRDRIWRNPGETADGRDSDGNGYVDDVHGWNFVDDTPKVFASPTEDLHGTHVAGIIVGREDRQSGFRGVAPDAKVMPLKFVGSNGSGLTSDAIRAIRYAADNGADVINASWGGEHGPVALRTAVAEAGIPFVASAGNTGVPHEQTPVYPGAFEIPNQITVAAVDHTGATASFSATSRRTVHVAAPGAAIVSTAPGGRMSVQSGTSMAAPFVAGTIALAVERRPKASAEELVRAVQHGARPLRGTPDTATGAIARAGGTLSALGVRVPACRSDPKVPFTDVGPDHVHRAGVACLVAMDVTSGVAADRYGAELGLTREQVASLVARTLRQAGDLPPVPATGRFADVEGSVHRDAIEALASVGILRGTTSTTYDPGRTVTRGEFAGIVARAAEHLAGATARIQGPAFDDIADSPERAGIETASALRLVSGRAPGRFEPDTPVRRDQAATMLVHLLDRLHQQGLVEAA